MGSLESLCPDGELEVWGLAGSYHPVQAPTSDLPVLSSCGTAASALNTLRTTLSAPGF